MSLLNKTTYKHRRRPRLLPRGQRQRPGGGPPGAEPRHLQDGLGALRVVLGRGFGQRHRVRDASQARADTQGEGDHFPPRGNVQAVEGEFIFFKLQFPLSSSCFVCWHEVAVVSFILQR